ncbi:MAG: type IV pilus twitching motility protein PilT [Planctomycetia bacterium]
MLDDVLMLFDMAVKARASDLILRTGSRPVARIDGKIRFLREEAFSEEDGEALLNQVLSPDEVMQFKVVKEKDTALALPGLGRFRANIMRQRRRTAFVFRVVKETIPSMQGLALPAAPLERLALLERGLVLVTGIAGSGKSTTLAAMIDLMNKRTARHIVTVEDPIEYLFRDGTCAITQREIGIDTPDYHTALKSVVRQTPDVILVGEMRDLETVSAVLTAAETGHLVLSTLHTVNAVQTVERILSFFPPHQHSLIRTQLSMVLEGVVSQRLISKRGSTGRVPAVEILLGTPTVKELLLQGKTRELATALEEGHEHYGSQSFNQSLAGLVRDGIIEVDDAMAAADNPDELRLALRGITKGAQGPGGAPQQAPAPAARRPLIQPGNQAPR